MSSKKNIESNQDDNVTDIEHEDVTNTPDLNQPEVEAGRELEAFNQGTTSLTTTGNSLAKFDDIRTLKDAYTYAEILIDSKSIPSTFNTPEKVIFAIAKGKELGMGATTALENIFFINGRAGLSVHAIAARLRSKGIKYTLVKDCIREKVETMDDKGNPAERVDLVCEIHFKEWWKEAKEVVTTVFRLTWSEVELAGWHTKPTWKSMPKIMMRNRCLALGARFVAPDAFLGVYSIEEQADIHNINMQYTEEGEVVLKP